MSAENLVESLCMALMQAAHEYRTQKYDVSYSQDPDWWWELKARHRLFDEAHSVIKKVTVDASTPISQLKTAILNALIEHEWGWGENWSSSVHTRTIKMIHDFIAERLGEE